MGSQLKTNQKQTNVCVVDEDEMVMDDIHVEIHAEEDDFESEESDNELSEQTAEQSSGPEQNPEPVRIQTPVAPIPQHLAHLRNDPDFQKMIQDMVHKGISSHGMINHLANEQNSDKQNTNQKAHMLIEW